MKQSSKCKETFTFKTPNIFKIKKSYIQKIHILPIYDGKYFKIKYIYQEKKELLNLDYSNTLAYTLEFLILLRLLIPTRLLQSLMASIYYFSSNGIKNKMVDCRYQTFAEN